MDNQQWQQWLDESRAKQARLNAQNYAMPSFERPQPTGPMRGTFSVAGPGEGVTWQNQVTSSGWGGNAPGYSPNRGVRQWGQEYNDAEDRAFMEKSRMFDADEARRNALEEQSYARSRLREGAGPPAMQEWQRYQDVMAQPYVRPEPQFQQMNDYTQQYSAPSWQAGGVGRTGREVPNVQSEAGLEDQFGDILAAVSAAGLVKNLATAGVRGLAGLGRPKPSIPEAWEPATSWGRSGLKDPNLIPRTTATRSGGEVLEAATQTAPRIGQDLVPYGQGAARLPQPGPTSWPNGAMRPADLSWLRNSVDPRGQQLFNALRQYYNPLTQGSGPKMPQELLRLVQNFYSRP